MLFINILSLYIIIVTTLAIFCEAKIRTLNGSYFANPMLLLSTAVCFYLFGYAFELNSSSYTQICFWNHVEYIGIPFGSALWLTVALIYTGNFVKYKKILISAIYIIPFITLILRFTNNYHHLYFLSVSCVREFGKLFMEKEPGPWMYVQTVHSLLMVILSAGLFIYDSIKSENNQMGKFILTACANSFAIAGLVMSQLKPFGQYLDYMALCLPITCLLVVLAIMRYDLLEIKSIARNMSFESSSDAILLVNHKNKIIDFNKNAVEFFSLLNIRLENAYLSTLFSSVPDLLEGLEKPESSVVKLTIDGKQQYYDISTKELGNQLTPHGWIKAIRNVTEVYQLNEELKKLALVDELSTLNNRRAFMLYGKEIVLEAETEGRTLYLMMFDLDHFKVVNDKYGHPAGDMVINNFSKMLKQHFGDDCLIARIGGEEFAVLSPETADTKLLMSVNSFLKEAEEHTYNYQNDSFHVTVSIGVTKKYPKQNLYSLLRNADKALYFSKDRGRNCITML